MMDQLTQLSRNIASSLLEVGAVSLRPHEPFTWTSGLKSPIYCDNRITISYPAIRKEIAKGFADVIREHYPDAEAIAGIATGGIPHGAWVADLLDLPMIYIRGKAKGHGKDNVIEGDLRAGQKVVLIEDLISTGGSSLKAALEVRQAGAKPLGVIAIFTYQFAQAEEAFARERIPLRTLSNYSTLIDVALDQGKIDAAAVSVLKSWQENPERYGQPSS